MGFVKILASKANPSRIHSYIWLVLSFIVYWASIWYQDRILRHNHKMSNILGFLTLMSTTVICIRGSSCLMKGVRANLYLIGLSLLVVISIVVTNRGQIAAGLVARLFFKSTKIIPTVIFESFLIKSLPSPARLTGCVILTLGCFSYFKSTSIMHSLTKESQAYYALGVAYLLIGAIIDSALTVIEKFMFLKPDAMCALTSTQLAFGCAWWGLLTFSIGSASGLLDMDFEHTLTLSTTTTPLLTHHPPPPAHDARPGHARVGRRVDVTRVTTNRRGCGEFL